MKMFLFIVLLFIAVSLSMMRLATFWIGNRVEVLYPPEGEFAEVDGVRMHYTDHPAGDDADLPPLVFIHGASGNLRDLEAPMLERLEGRARLIFVDRPGHGYSQGWTATQKHTHLPNGQADLIAGLLEKIGISEAVLIGHSYGANTALLMAYELRKMNIPVALLVFYDLTDSGKVPPNVDHVLNFRSSSSTGINVTVTGAAHFHGTIDNVTRADLNHITIDKQQDLHKQTIETIAKLFGKDARTSLN